MNSKYKVRRLAIFGIISVFVIILVTSSFLKFNKNLNEKKAEIALIKEQLELLEKDEELLELEIDKLQDPNYLLRYAREQYLYSNDNEIIFTLPKD
jgi:cell division protein DivIC